LFISIAWRVILARCARCKTEPLSEIAEEPFIRPCIPSEADEQAATPVRNSRVNGHSDGLVASAKQLAKANGLDIVMMSRLFRFKIKK